MSGRSPGQSHDQYSTGRGNSFPYPYITAVLTTFCMLHKLMKSKIQLLKLSVYFLNLFLQSFICQLQALKAFPPKKKVVRRYKILQTILACTFQCSFQLNTV